MKDLKVLELFAGIGACSKALTNLGIPHTIVDAVEVDPYAIKSFNAVHGTNFEPQDVKEWDKNIDVDLIMHGSPCQDFSSAGLQKGGDKDSGTRSSLMYETLRIVEKLKPKYVIWENVKNLLSKKHIHNFENYIRQMESLGYNSSYQVLNAKDYGVPQNRERVFTVSIRNDLDVDFKFPEPQELTARLKDILEPQVDEKYYLSDEQIKKLKTVTYNTGAGKNRDSRQPKIIARTDSHQKGGVYETNSVSPTLMATAYKQPTQIAEPKLEFVGAIGDKDIVGDGKTLSRNCPQGNRVWSSDGLAASKTATGGGIGGHTGLYTEPTPLQRKVCNEVGGAIGRIRKLTPKECWRLMGFSDDDFEKAQGVGISNTQLYKQAGNSIVVDVLYNIFKELLNGKEN